ncbi:MAG: SEC-C metal-binding domain-containing protein [Candidatus Acidiferrales bacterium]
MHGEKELVEKLGRNDPCPCGSGRRFQEMLYGGRPLRRVAAESLREINKYGARRKPCPFQFAP